MSVTYVEMCVWPELACMLELFFGRALILRAGTQWML